MKLLQFFEKGKAVLKSTPETRGLYSSAWSMEQLKVKSNDDLHKLWYILLKERNLLATQRNESKRINRRWFGKSREDKVRLSMSRIKNIMSTGSSSDVAKKRQVMRLSKKTHPLFD